MRTVRLPLLTFAAMLAAGVAQAQAQTGPAPASADPIARAAFKAPLVSPYVPDKLILPEGVAQTSVETSLHEGVTGSLGFLCGLQAPYAHAGIADARGYDPDGKFVGAKLAFAFK